MWAAYVDLPSTYLALMGALAMILPFILVLALATVLLFCLAPSRYPLRLPMGLFFYRLLTSRLRPRAPTVPILTAEEIEVLRLTARGFTIREIARHLSLSPNMVKRRMRNVYRKLDPAG